MTIGELAGRVIAYYSLSGPVSWDTARAYVRDYIDTQHPNLSQQQLSEIEKVLSDTATRIIEELAG